MAEYPTKENNSKITFTVRIPTDLRWKAQELVAHNRMRSLNAFIIDLLEKAVKDEQTGVSP